MENAQYFGKKEWDSWNIDSIKSLSIYGAILLFLLWPVGLALLAIDAVVIYFSFRPYWQINKTYVTGKMGAVERLVTILGDYAARFGGWFLRFLVKLVVAIFRFVVWLANGDLFR